MSLASPNPRPKFHSPLGQVRELDHFFGGSVDVFQNVYGEDDTCRAVEIVFRSYFGSTVLKLSIPSTLVLTILLARTKFLLRVTRDHRNVQLTK